MLSGIVSEFVNNSVLYMEVRMWYILIPNFELTLIFFQDLYILVLDDVASTHPTQQQQQQQLQHKKHQSQRPFPTLECIMLKYNRKTWLKDEVFSSLKTCSWINEWMEFLCDTSVFVTLSEILFFILKCVYTYILYYKDNFYHNRIL